MSCCDSVAIPSGPRPFYDPCYCCCWPWPSPPPIRWRHLCQCPVCTQLLIQNQRRVPASLYTMNLGASTVAGYLGGTRSNKPTMKYSNVNWNQRSDRNVPAVQKRYVPTRGSSTMSSVTRHRPGSSGPAGKGVDIKHGSYDRYLARKKAKNLNTQLYDAVSPAPPIWNECKCCDSTGTVNKFPCDDPSGCSEDCSGCWGPIKCLEPGDVWPLDAHPLPQQGNKVRKYGLLGFYGNVCMPSCATKLTTYLDCDSTILPPCPPPPCPPCCKPPPCPTGPPIPCPVCKPCCKLPK